MRRNPITIEGFETLSKQQLFDMSASHIMAQGRAGWDSKLHVCRYKAGCAASIFIQPEWAETADNTGGSWDAMARINLVPLHEMELVTSLQQLHDKAANAAHHTTVDGVVMDDDAFMVRWTHDMREFANANNLNADVLAA